jgi:hypothetical protein
MSKYKFLELRILHPAGSNLQPYDPNHMILPRSGGLQARAVIRHIISVLSRVLAAGSISTLVASEDVALMENMERILRMFERLPDLSPMQFNRSSI